MTDALKENPFWYVPWQRFNTAQGKDVLRLRTLLEHYFREYFISNGYEQLTSPKIVSQGLEQTITPFQIDFFGEPAILSKGPQTYKSILIAAGVPKVFEIGPIFRMEQKYGPDHVAEFVAIDADFSVNSRGTPVKCVDDVIDEFEDMLAYAVNRLCDGSAGKGLKLDVRPPVKFPRISIRDAYNILAENGVRKEQWDDLSKADETILGDWAVREHGSDFLVVGSYPAAYRFFYYKKHDDNPQLTHSFDVLYRGREISTCALKVNDLDTLLKQAGEQGLDLERSVPHLVDAYRQGLPTFGGGGIGFDRLVQKLLNQPNIRDALIISREPGRLRP